MYCKMTPKVFGQEELQTKREINCFTLHAFYYCFDSGVNISNLGFFKHSGAVRADHSIKVFVGKRQKFGRKGVWVC